MRVLVRASLLAFLAGALVHAQPPRVHRLEATQAAYQLVSIAGNVAITQLVDKPNVGVHVRLPKSIFVAK